jgi:hypothetical protein
MKDMQVFHLEKILVAGKNAERLIAATQTAGETDCLETVCRHHSLLTVGSTGAATASCHHSEVR